jgi:hypothetical protein
MLTCITIQRLWVVVYSLLYVSLPLNCNGSNMTRITALIPLMRPFAEWEFCSFIRRAPEITTVIFVNGNNVKVNTSCAHVDIFDLDFSRHPFTRIGAAERYAAGLLVDTEWVLHLDDDRFGEARGQWGNIIHSIRKYPSDHFFTTHQNIRRCSSHGYYFLNYTLEYHLLRKQSLSSGKYYIGLTAFALVSRRLHFMYLREFSFYRKLLNMTGGNGEDITYARVAAHHNIFPTVVNLNNEFRNRRLQSYRSYEVGGHHMKIRSMLCEILFSSVEHRLTSNQMKHLNERLIDI